MPVDSGGVKLLPLEVEGLLDVARLACALEKIPRPVLAFKGGDGYRVGVIADYVDGRLLFLHAHVNKVDDYICYRVDDGVEECSFSSTAAKLPVVCAPVIRIRRAPRGLVIKTPSTKGLKLVLIEVEDLTSVVVLGAYKSMVNESPAPVLYVPTSSNGGLLGVLVRIAEDDKSVVFFYCRGKATDKGFIRVDPNKVGDLSFTNLINEPGYLYVKLAKLKPRSLPFKLPSP